jgi:predicted enzyme related to lactoylglutathione lyase
MNDISARFVGFEIYFQDLDKAKSFYADTLGLRVSEDRPGHYAKFESGEGFLCLERKGSESYPSSDKAVLFFHVPDLQSAVTAIGESRFVQSERRWAVIARSGRPQHRAD